MNPTRGDVHVNRPLTNISIAYLQDSSRFVADKVFPNIPVLKQSDRYFQYDRGEFNRDEMRERAPGTESAGGSYDVDSTPTYFCRVYAFHKDIPDQIRANSDEPLNEDRESTEYVSHKALIKREKVFADTYFKAGVWTTDKTDSTWGDYATGTNPITEIKDAKRAGAASTGFEFNTLVFGRKVYDVLSDHPDVIERVNAGQTPGNPAMGTLMAMMTLFEIENIYVMNAIENTGKEGDTASHDFIGGAHALLCYSAPRPGIMTPSAGYNFSWTGFLAAGNMGNRIKKFRMENLESDRVEIQSAFDMKKVSADLGYFFVDPSAAS